MPFDGLSATQQLICDPTLDQRIITPGSFMGQSLYVPLSAGRAPRITLGFSDFTIEWVQRFRGGDPSIGLADIPHLSGLVEDLSDMSGDFGDIVLGQLLLPGPPFATQAINCLLDFTFWPGGTVGGSIFVAWPPPQSAWVHVAVTFDRDGMAEMWVNGVLDTLDPEDISADANVFLDDVQSAWHPNIGETDFRSDFDDLLDDPTAVNLHKITMAGMALHKRLLTPQEIQSNSNNLTVGNYGKNTTLLRWDFTKIVDSNGDGLELDKEQPDTDIGLGQKWTVQAPQASELFGLRAVNGSAYIEDTSGNNRDYGLETALSYSSATLDDRCIVAFAETGAL